MIAILLMSLVFSPAQASSPAEEVKQMGEVFVKHLDCSNIQKSKVDPTITNYFCGGKYVTRIKNGQDCLYIWKDKKIEGDYVCYINGKKFFEQKMVRSVKQGPYKEFNPDGTLIMYGSFKQNMFDGFWYRYDSKGREVLKVLFVEDDDRMVMAIDPVTGKTVIQLTLENGEVVSGKRFKDDAEAGPATKEDVKAHIKEHLGVDIPVRLVFRKQN